uniref:Cytochrome P450 family 4 subfamily B member 37 n=1 Tax=Sphenodon punctatus TaxID=8508 RepID=A0A8D0GZV9_SPHPU
LSVPWIDPCSMPGAFFWHYADISHFFQLAAVACLTCLLLKAIQLYQRKRWMTNVLRDFQGAPTHWFYGHVQSLKQEEELANTAAWAKKYPHCHPLWFGGFLCFLNINHTEYAKAVYSRGGRDTASYVSMIVARRGLLILNGPKWHQHRRLLTPGFHYDILKSYVTLMAESVRVMLDKWEKLIPEKKSVELFEHVSLMTLDSIMKCIFNPSPSLLCRGNSYIQTVLDLSVMLHKRILMPLYHNEIIYWFSASGRRFRKACRLAQHHTGILYGPSDPGLQILKKRRLDFLDILLCARDEHGNGLSDEDLRAEVDTFMFAGHDTTASGISWILYCLAQYPEHQQKCREEINDLLADRDTIEDDLGKMPYSTMFIKECLRLYPPVLLVGRELSAPVTFADGRSLPKGFLTSLSIYGLHRNPEVWPNPEVFLALKGFESQTYEKRLSENCIGQHFAMNEMKISLALTLSRFELSPDPEKPPVPIHLIVLRSKNGIHVYLRKLC